MNIRRKFLPILLQLIADCDFCQSSKARNLNVKTSLSAGEIGPTNESKSSKRCGVIRTKREKYSLSNRRNSYVVKTVFFSFLEDLSHPKPSACVYILHFAKHY